MAAGDEGVGPNGPPDGAAWGRRKSSTGNRIGPEVGIRNRRAGKSPKSSWEREPFVQEECRENQALRHRGVEAILLAPAACRVDASHLLVLPQRCLLRVQRATVATAVLARGGVGQQRGQQDPYGGKDPRGDLGAARATLARSPREVCGDRAGEGRDPHATPGPAGSVRQADRGGRRGVVGAPRLPWKRAQTRREMKRPVAQSLRDRRGGRCHRRCQEQVAHQRVRRRRPASSSRSGGDAVEVARLLRR